MTQLPNVGELLVTRLLLYAIVVLTAFHELSEMSELASRRAGWGMRQDDRKNFLKRVIFLIKKNNHNKTK